MFNAKELDNETGLYYYGARYLDPTGAMWLSVDPMWEKYAGMSPYNYCAGNPVKLVDPDGMKPTLIKYMEPNNELYFRTAITLGGQIGFNFADFASFELNLGAIDLISLNFKGKDGKGGVDAWTVRHVAEDYPRVTQKGVYRCRYSCCWGCFFKSRKGL